MKIALMTNNYKPFIGGVPISIERLEKELTNQGHQVTVFAPTYEEALMQPWLHSERERHVFRYASFQRKVLGGITLPNPFDRRIEAEFAKGHFDVIHVHHPMLIGRTAVHLSQKYNVPLAFTYHTKYEQYLTSYTGMDILEPIVPLWLRCFLKRCDIIFAPTKGLKEYLYTSCKIPAEKLSVLPTGLEKESYLADEQKIQNIRQKYHAENSPIFLTVARLAPEKNLDFLLDSMAQVKKRCNKPFCWVIVGDGPQRAYLQEKSRRIFSEKEIYFTGKVPNEDTPAYFQAADAFLFSSKTETQGIVVLEAMAGKTPVYALRATGVEDLVENGVNGYLTEEDIFLYAEKIVDFLEKKCDCEKLSRDAYQTALKYREEAVAIQAVRLYNRIIVERNGRKIPKIEGRHSWKTTSITY